MTWLAAGVSNGTLDGDLNGEAAGVIMLSAEDDNADTIRPRLEAHGADLANIRGIDEDAPTFPEDLERLRQSIIRHGARLVVIDPIASHLGEGVSLHNDVSLRRAVGPMKDIAADTDATTKFRTVYLGGAGVVDALHRLELRGFLELRGEYVAYLERSLEAPPDFPDEDPERSLWGGEVGIRLGLQRRRSRLAQRLRALGAFPTISPTWRDGSSR